MKNLFKKITSVILTASMAVSVIAGTTFGASATLGEGELKIKSGSEEASAAYEVDLAVDSTNGTSIVLTAATEGSIDSANGLPDTEWQITGGTDGIASLTGDTGSGVTAGTATVEVTKDAAAGDTIEVTATLDNITAIATITMIDAAAKADLLIKINDAATADVKNEATADVALTGEAIEVALEASFAKTVTNDIGVTVWEVASGDGATLKDADGTTKKVTAATATLQIPLAKAVEGAEFAVKATNGAGEATATITLFVKDAEGKGLLYVYAGEESTKAANTQTINVKAGEEVALTLAEKSDGKTLTLANSEWTLTEGAKAELSGLTAGKGAKATVKVAADAAKGAKFTVTAKNGEDNVAVANFKVVVDEDPAGKGDMLMYAGDKTDGAAKTLTFDENKAGDEVTLTVVADKDKTIADLDTATVWTIEGAAKAKVTFTAPTIKDGAYKDKTATIKIGDDVVDGDKFTIKATNGENVAVANFKIVIEEETAGDVEYVYEFWTEGKSSPFINASDKDADAQEIWAGGGKATLGNGAVIDGKTKQFFLFATEKDKDGKTVASYNVTTAKSTLWGVTASTEGKTLDEQKAAATNGKIDSTAMKNTAKVGKGKVTAGKTPGTVLLQAIAGFDKKLAGTDADKSVKVTPVEIEVKQAAAKVEVYDAACTEKTDGALDKGTNTVVKAINAPVGQKVKLFALGTDKTGAAVAHDDTTYSAAITKGGEYAKVNGKSTGLSLKDIATKGIEVEGVKLATGDKVAKATLVITNEQSGKKASVAVSIGNSVVSVEDTSEMKNELVPDEKSAKDATAVDVTEYLNTAEYLKAVAADDTAKRSSSTTDKPVIGLSTTKITADKYASSLFDTKGKPKFVATKAPKFTAKYADGKLTVKVPKKADVSATELFAYIVYNANKDDDGNYTGVLEVPFTIGAAADPNEISELKIALGGDGQDKTTGVIKADVAKADAATKLTFAGTKDLTLVEATDTVPNPKWTVAGANVAAGDYVEMVFELAEGKKFATDFGKDDVTVVAPEEGLGYEVTSAAAASGKLTVKLTVKKYEITVSALAIDIADATAGSKKFAAATGIASDAVPNDLKFSTATKNVAEDFTITVANAGPSQAISTTSTFTLKFKAAEGFTFVAGTKVTVPVVTGDEVMAFKVADTGGITLNEDKTELTVKLEVYETPVFVKTFGITTAGTKYAEATGITKDAIGTDVKATDATTFVAGAGSNVTFKAATWSTKDAEKVAAGDTVTLVYEASTAFKPDFAKTDVTGIEAPTEDTTPGTYLGYEVTSAEILADGYLQVVLTITATVVAEP